MKRFYENMPSEEIIRRMAEMARGQFLRSTTAHYDPIFTPIFTTLLGTATIGATTITYASIASAIATTALTYGLQALLAPTPPKAEDGKIPRMQAIPYIWWGVGMNRSAGAYMLWEAKGAILCAVQALRGHKITSFERYWFHDDEVTINGSGYVNGIGSRYARERARILTRLGTVPETAYTPIVDILGADDVWTNQHRGDGQASVAMVCINSPQNKQQKRFPFGPPQLSVETKDAAVWDFRDPAQDPEDPSTWQWSQNAALIMAWHQCFNEFGHRRDYRKAILPVLAMWKEEADICDELVPLASGGFERRYECNGIDTTEHEPKVATNAILATCDGWICERGDGALLFTVGKFRESRMSVLTDGDIVGHNIQYDVLFEDEINRLIPKFTFTETGYTTCDTDYFEDGAAQTTAGRVLAQDANYQWCQQWRQARRLGIRDWRRIQEKVSGSIDCRLSGINAALSRWVRIDAPNSMPSLNGKIVENRKTVLSLLNGGFSMDVMQHPDNIDDWDPATDEGQKPPVPPKVNALDIPTPDLVAATPVASGGSVYLRLTITDPADESLTPISRYRVADDGTGNPGPYVWQRFDEFDIASGQIVLATQPVPSDKTLNVQVSFMTADGDHGNWSTTINVVTAADPVAPQSLSSFAVSGSAPYLGGANFSVVTRNDPRVRTVDIYRVATGGPFNPAVLTPVNTVAVGPSSTYGGTDGDIQSNALANGGFSSGASWTAGANWTIGSGVATHASGSAATLSQAISGVASGDVLRGIFSVTARSAGNVAPQVSGGATIYGTPRTAVGTYPFSFTATASHTTFEFVPTSTFVGSIDNAYLFEQTAGCAPQGTWDYYAVPRNSSGIAGPSSGPVTIDIT